MPNKHVLFRSEARENAVSVASTLRLTEAGLIEPPEAGPCTRSRPLDPSGYIDTVR